MNDGYQIKYLQHQEIDKEKWNACINQASNGLIYTCSFYLDHMTKDWHALVLNDYEAVMPITWRKKYGIYYLYQPFLTPQLGIFGKNVTEFLVEKFLKSVPKHFKFWEINLNFQNLAATTKDYRVSNGTDCVMSLKENYDAIRSQYRQNHKRSIKKAIDAGCKVQKHIPLEDMIGLSKDQLDQYTSYSSSDITQFKQLCEFLIKEQKAETYGVYLENKLLSSCIFFFHNNRAYYILAGNHPDSRTTGASHLLFDRFIEEYSEKDILLDFVGSDFEGIRSFYEGFGASCLHYPSLGKNKLPFMLRWLKK